MKRKLVVVGDMRFMMKDVFRINDKEVDQVVKFLGKDYEYILDAIKKAADSDELNERQKMLISYIVGNTSGVMQAQVGLIPKEDRDVPDIGM